MAAISHILYPRIIHYGHIYGHIGVANGIPKIDLKSSTTTNLLSFYLRKIRDALHCDTHELQAYNKGQSNVYPRTIHSR